MTGALSPPIEGGLTIQLNTNMLKIIKKVRFCRFYRFFVKMQSPGCPPKILHNAIQTSQHTDIKQYT